MLQIGSRIQELLNISENSAFREDFYVTIPSRVHWMLALEKESAKPRELKFNEWIMVAVNRRQEANHSSSFDVFIDIYSISTFLRQAFR